MTSPRGLLSASLTALQEFTSSQASLRIIQTISHSNTAPPGPPSTIFVLDSSFNPPTQAHLRLASSALRSQSASPTNRINRPTTTRLLLLLATQNADKAPKPAAFEQRLTMMSLLAQDILDVVPQDSEVAIDIGLTKLPYFVGKAKAIAENAAYSVSGKEEPVRQVHLVGFDTLIRILDTKYYPPEHTLEPLGELFKWHALRVMFRPDDGWGGKGEQGRYVEELRSGGREHEGGKREWAERIEMVEGSRDGEEAVSSTKAREAAERGDRTLVGELCTRAVAEWITSEGLYVESQ
ncbi:MAG: hypothetical protein MMC23_007004 [Stictis urceolatum]|nr:hypothetical protein [Stictis urceolata]